MGIVQDSGKGVWFAFGDGGLARYLDGRFRPFGEAQGLPSVKVAGIAVDPQGRVWCSIVDHGLVRIDDSSGERLKLTGYSVTARVAYNPPIGAPLTADRQGRIYVGLLHGVDRLDPATGAVTHYGPDDGVPDGPIWNLADDGKGAIWVGGRKNVVRILPDAAREAVPAPVLISSLRVSGEDYQLSATGARSLELKELPYQKNSLEIGFLSLSFAAGQSPLFQYRLEGADSAWGAAMPLGRVNYANLSPGNYRFQVRVVSRPEEAGVAPAQLTFRILQPFWKQTWFIGGLLLIGFGSLAGFERYRATKVSQLRSAMGALRSANEALDIESAISRILAQGKDEGAYPGLLAALSQKTGWNRAVLWEHDRQTAQLRRAADWPPFKRIASGDLAGKAATSRQVEWIAEPEGRACFPILVGESLLGVIEFEADGPRDPGPARTGNLLAISRMIGQWMERLRAERALRASEESFRTLADTASDAILTIDERGVILFCNSSAADVFGHPGEQMIGRELVMLMPARLREAHRQEIGDYLHNGKGRSLRAIELPGVHADGHEMELELSFGEFKRGEERQFTAVVRDVTERKQTEEALRRSREERIAEIERVRRRIAIDLHDDIGSSLTQISLLSEVVRRQLGGSSELEKPLDMIAGSSRELIDAMSDIVWAISPQRDHLTDLTHRMRRFAADTLTARNIEFTMDLPAPAEDVKLEGNLRREVFLIFKEALNNAVRHSHCTRAEIELRLEGHSLRLRVRDNGMGFDTGRASDGHGLNSMSSRASGIGARFELASQLGQGSVITLDVPLHAA
jgi:PAS domain S-box-containing protein